MSSSKYKNKTTLTNKQRQDIITYKSKYPNIINIELVKKHKEDALVDNAVIATTIPKLKELLKEYNLKDLQ
ncbi:35588_t:CDS:2 [Gigaspora margarita]|uniref:35588_t:CDS:1 n=1 Tax=Gigaspora margarita TaxID=4874 RepID=A0ABN7UUR1_GIGMA|nr:35588_t:CDS:2 [Gigaspora margarita]